MRTTATQRRMFAAGRIGSLNGADRRRLAGQIMSTRHEGPALVDAKVIPCERFLHERLHRAHYLLDGPEDAPPAGAA